MTLNYFHCDYSNIRTMYVWTIRKWEGWESRMPEPLNNSTPENTLQLVSCAFINKQLVPTRNLI